MGREDADHWDESNDGAWVENPTERLWVIGCGRPASHSARRRLSRATTSGWPSAAFIFSEASSGSLTRNDPLIGSPGKRWVVSSTSNICFQSPARTAQLDSNCQCNTPCGVGASADRITGTRLLPSMGFLGSATPQSSAIVGSQSQPCA